MCGAFAAAKPASLGHNPRGLAAKVKQQKNTKKGLGDMCEPSNQREHRAPLALSLLLTALHLGALRLGDGGGDRFGHPRAAVLRVSASGTQAEQAAHLLRRGRVA